MAWIHRWRYGWGVGGTSAVTKEPFDGTSMPSYVAITPARNEAQNLLRLAACMIEQTLPPDQWIIVDNGSTDDTLAIARKLADEHAWISVAEVSGEAVETRGAPVVRAFHAGVESIDGRPEFVVKLDADVSFSSDYFAQQSEAFRLDPSLGIAGGICLEPTPDGSWMAARVTRDHVRGAVRAYRWECLHQVVPLEERMGWDGIDELKAQVHGWHVRSLAELVFYHHRVIGSREAKWPKWVRQGDMAHFMGYRYSYLVARTLYYLPKEPSAIGMLWGYGNAVVSRKPRCAAEAAIRHLRRQQSFRALPSRMREKLGLA